MFRRVGGRTDGSHKLWMSRNTKIELLVEEPLCSFLAPFQSRVDYVKVLLHITRNLFIALTIKCT